MTTQTKAHQFHLLLDARDVSLLRRLARRFRCSAAEVVRRALRQMDARQPAVGE